MICNLCKAGADMRGNSPLKQQVKKDMHKKCKGGTWCDCQHRSK